MSSCADDSTPAGRWECLRAGVGLPGEELPPAVALGLTMSRNCVRSTPDAAAALPGRRLDLLQLDL